MNNIDWNNKQEVLKTVAKDGSALQYTSDILQNDKEIVLAAVTQNGHALEYASERLKKDYDVVLAAITKNDLFMVPENKKYDIENEQWLEERMKIRNILIQQILMQESIPNKGNKKTVQSRSLKF